MLGSRIEELLASEIEANGGFSFIADETRQRQLLLEDEEEDFMDEGILLYKCIPWTEYYSYALSKREESLINVVLFWVMHMSRYLLV